MEEQPRPASKTERFWVGIGKLAVLISVIAGIWGLVNHFISPRARLVADVHISSFHPPPATKPSPLERAESLLRSEEVQASFLEGLSPTQAKAFELAMASLLSRLPLEFFEPRVELRTCLVVEVRNEGDLPADDAALIMKDLEIATVELPDQPISTVRSAGTFPLGRLRAGSNARIVAWTSSDQIFLAADSIRLSHAGGLGRLNFYADRRRISGLFYDRSIWPLGGVLLICLVAVVSVGVMGMRAKPTVITTTLGAAGPQPPKLDASQ